MSILYLLIPMALVLMGIAIWAFIWAIKTGQFDDLEGPAHRILMDDDDPRIPRSRTSRRRGWWQERWTTITFKRKTDANRDSGRKPL